MCCVLTFPYLSCQFHFLTPTHSQSFSLTPMQRHPTRIPDHSEWSSNNAGRVRLIFNTSSQPFGHNVLHYIMTNSCLSIIRNFNIAHAWCVLCVFVCHDQKPQCETSVAINHVAYACANCDFIMGQHCHRQISIAVRKSVYGISVEKRCGRIV